jgi:hypothetical protein
MAAGKVWNQRSFRINCEELAANARWWYQFKLFGKFLYVLVDASLTFLFCYSRYSF